METAKMFPRKQIEIMASTISLLSVQNVAIIGKDTWVIANNLLFSRNPLVSTS